MENEARKERAKWVQTLLDSGLSFALYRLPQQQEVRLILQRTGDARPLTGHEREPRGFLLAPFTETAGRPALLIRPDVAACGWEAIGEATTTLPQRALRLQRQLPRHPGTSGYERAFGMAMKRLQDGRFEKVVLAEKRWLTGREGLFGREASVFCRAVEGFPNSMVSLVYTPVSGRWMGITPEVLLEREGGQFHTMALAGTKTSTRQRWDRKNRQEHQTVVQYLADTLEAQGIPCTRRDPYTRPAGNLFHLCTDFRFPHTSACSTMQLLRLLHPTPAVCGLPKAETLLFLRRSEGCGRTYYSGYLGPANVAGGTHVFVNLRCALIGRHGTVFYAGGGVNRLSTYRKERTEIEHKMNVLMHLTHD